MMAPINPHVVSQLRQLVYYHLDCNLLRNALFFAGRLQAYDSRSTEASYLLALCHLKFGQLKAAHDYSRNTGSRGTHLGCSYVFAQACLGLEKYVEGATALERSKGLWSVRNSWGKHTDTRRQHLPDAAAVLCLQGKLWQAHSDHQKAIECFAEALKANPFMWDAFTSLCELGANVRTQNIFKMTPEMRNLMNDAPEQTPFGIFEESSANALAHSDVNIVASQSHNTTDPFSVSKNRVNGEIKNHTVNAALYEKMSNTSNIITPLSTQDISVGETPTGNVGISDPDIFFGKPSMNEPPLAPVRKGRGLPGLGLDLTSDAPPKMRTNTTVRSKSRTNIRSEEHEDLGNKASATSHGSDLKRTISGKSAHAAASTARPGVVDPAIQQRKSVRLLNQLKPSSRSAGFNQVGSMREEREMRKAKAPSSKARSANSFNVGRVVSGNRKHQEPMDIDGKEQRPPGAANVSAQQPNQNQSQKPMVNERAREVEALQWLLDLVHKLGTGYSLLSQYQCQDALVAFQTVPASQRETPWVLAQIGRAYYEQAAYADAEKIFSRIRTMSPSRLEDMEYYSTSLWHLKQDVDLAFLSHELVDLDRLSPQAWCAVGNSCSLQRDHDQALKCFKRATQLDPSFAYAYTLQGHEYVQNEEFDKAMSAYRAAITAENRHYNAWYGLGRVFEKQGRYSVAEHHYRTAQQINPTNAVLITCIGLMLEKQKNLKAALVKYSEACQIAEKGTLWRFKKARVLDALNQPERALLELLVLKDIAPDEANVHFSLGKVYKKLGQKGEAIRHFTMALNLDPKASSHIKEAMEELDNDSEEEMDM